MICNVYKNTLFITIKSIYPNCGGQSDPKERKMSK